MTNSPSPLPLVYACSGCSSAAQLANHLAVQLDRQQVAEMSCIAGVGGDVPHLLRKARDARASHRHIVAIDGCVLQCARACLARHDIVPDHHVRLHELGVKKTYHQDFDPAQAAALLRDLTLSVTQAESCPTICVKRDTSS